MNFENIATVIFSHPPIGTVGMSEEQAVKKHGKDSVKCFKSSFINMFYSPSKEDDLKMKSFFKIICHIEEDGTERVVGVHAIGRGVDEMMQGLSIAV